MKRSIISKYFSIFLITVYLGVLLFYFFTTGKVLPFWFSLACVMISFWCFLKAYYFNLDSSLFLGCFLFFSGFLAILRYFVVLPHNLSVFCYVLSVALALLITGVFYKKKLHYRISFILLLEDFLILLYSYNILTLLSFIILSSIMVLIGELYVFKRNKRL